jgi:hypothetical protein
MKTRRGCREVLIPTREQAKIGFLRVQETAPAGETAEAANLVGLLPEGPAGGAIREQRRDAGLRQWFLSR